MPIVTRLANRAADAAQAVEDFLQDAGCAALEFLADRNGAANLGGFFGEEFAGAVDVSFVADGRVFLTGLAGVGAVSQTPCLAITSTRS